jgi:valacyclovir hydrolase
MAWFEDGTSTVYYEVTGSADRTVLLLPGLTDDIGEHMALRRALAEAGYRVIAADLPGSGRSLPLPRTYSATYFDEDAGSFTRLLLYLAAESAHVVGFSDGGEVALVMAEVFPDTVQSVVAWGSVGQINDPTGELRTAFYDIIDNPTPELVEFSEQLIGTYGRHNARAMTQNAAQAMSEIIETRGGDVRLSRADTIKCPVLLITGEHDAYASFPLVTELGARIARARTIEVKGAAHDVHASHSGWLIATLLEWLRALAPT